MKSLLLLCGVQFMVVLDVTVVNVALPAIGADLGVSDGGLHWVISAYALAFGGFLLVGGRAGDLLGRRRIFPRRPRSVRHLVARLRSCLERGGAHRRPGRPGPRQRARLADRVRDPDRDLRGGR